MDVDLREAVQQLPSWYVTLSALVLLILLLVAVLVRQFRANIEQDRIGRKMARSLQRYIRAEIQAEEQKHRQAA